ncbi:nucleoid-associated protein [bacterium]|nr:nucleoid-associated protein [bacterium]
MIDYTNCNIKQVAVHRIGNKTNGEDLHLSKTNLDISDGELRELLIQYFLKPFPDPEFYNFTSSNNDFELNPLFKYVTDIFDSSNSFHTNSINIARHLFENSLHQNIKSGDLFVAKFVDILINNRSTDVVGIFKSENIHSFLKLDQTTDDFIIEYDDGINIDKLDKGCLIFNSGKSEGYRICIVDKSNKSSEARYWRDTFLNLKPCNDNYHQTTQFLDIARNYITKQYSEEFKVDKTDKIDLLNRSVHYFKNHESFKSEEFESDVLYDENVIKSFRSYKSIHNGTNDIYVDDEFGISPNAVKKQNRVFKSVLKLDKNFHIYIHGDKRMIEKGVERDGRKYYKIFYDIEK